MPFALLNHRITKFREIYHKFGRYPVDTGYEILIYTGSVFPSQEMKIRQEASQLGIASERYRISYGQLSESAPDPAAQCAGSARVGSR